MAAMLKAIRLSGTALLLSMSIIVGWPGPPTEAGPLPDLACRSLATLYARVPECFDPPEVAALQACIGAAQTELAPAPAPAPVPQPPRPQRVDRFRGEWPESAPWTTPDQFPYPTMW
ncbi:MAG TPA: hypothetical protein VMD08_06875 [Candidatus Baltobacteraceae bacterium]|nr:hypothetical protein [Candidatus Baltobacteraceae bacterium]